LAAEIVVAARYFFPLLLVLRAVLIRLLEIRNFPINPQAPALGRGVVVPDDPVAQHGTPIRDDRHRDCQVCRCPAFRAALMINTFSKAAGLSELKFTLTRLKAFLRVRSGNHAVDTRCIQGVSSAPEHPAYPCVTRSCHHPALQIRTEAPGRLDSYTSEQSDN
jgi:hypothetical protein